MASTAVAVINDTMPTTYEEYRKLNVEDRLALSGQGAKFGNMLPRFKINYTSEVEVDGKDIQIPKGRWTVNVRDANDNPVTVLAEKATARVLIRGYRYSVYDTTNNKLVLISSIFKNWGDTVIDTLGNEYTAAKYKKAVLADFPEFANKPTKLQCQQVLYSIVTLVDGVDIHKKPVEVVNLPVIWVAKGSGFMPVADALTDLTNKKVSMEEYPFTVTTKVVKNAELKWWEPVLQVQEPVEYTEADFQLTKDFQSTINAENAEVLTVFNKRLTNELSEKDVAESISGSDLSKDFNDELTF